ncbi:hypothetical protein JRQ81_018824, partial [Phrynocephalus forsythii]
MLYTGITVFDIFQKQKRGASDPPEVPSDCGKSQWHGGTGPGATMRRRWHPLGQEGAGAWLGPTGWACSPACCPSSPWLGLGPVWLAVVVGLTALRLAKEMAFVEVVQSSPGSDYTTYTTELQGHFFHTRATLSTQGEIIQMSHAACCAPGPLQCCHHPGLVGGYLGGVSPPEPGCPHARTALPRKRQPESQSLLNQDVLQGCPGTQCFLRICGSRKDLLDSRLSIAERNPNPPPLEQPRGLLPQVGRWLRLAGLQGGEARGGRSVWERKRVDLRESSRIRQNPAFPHSRRMIRTSDDHAAARSQCQALGGGGGGGPSAQIPGGRGKGERDWSPSHSEEEEEEEEEEERGGRQPPGQKKRMDFQQLADVADKWCSNNPFELIATEETERRMDFYADPGVSFYVLCPDTGCGDNFHVWSESEDCLPFLQLAQDYISSCGKKTLHEILEKVLKSFRP